MSAKYILQFCDSNGHPLAQTVFCCDEKNRYKANRKIIAFVAKYLFKNIFNLHRGERFVVQKLEDDMEPVLMSAPQQDFNNPSVLQRARKLGITLREFAVLHCKYKGLSHSEAANELRISYYALESRLRKAFNKLKVNCWQLAIEKILQNQSN